MAEELKQSTAVNKLIFMTDSADHISGKEGLTLTIAASKNGGDFASITPTVTERGNGWYSLAFTASHTDTLGDLGLHVTGTGADPTDMRFVVVPVLPDVNAAKIGGLDATPDETVSDNVTTLLTRIPGTVQPQTGDAYARIGANGAGLTALGDTRIANLDAAISTRSTYAGADTSGTTTLLARLTNTRAGLLDNMDAAVSTRMATFSYTTPPTAAAIATAILTTTDTSNFAVDGSPGKILVTQLGGAFTTQGSSVLKDTALVNAPSGSGVTLEELQDELTTRYVTTANMRAIAAVSFGDWSENSDHTATTFKDVNNPATTVITSVNTATSRTVTLE